MTTRTCSVCCRRGVAMAEFALVLPLILMPMVVIVDVARAFYHLQTITNCARNGALYQSSQTASGLRRAYADYKSAALADVSNFSPALKASDISSSTSGTHVSVTVEYPFVSLFGVETKLSRTVTMRVLPSSPDF